MCVSLHHLLTITVFLFNITLSFVMCEFRTSSYNNMIIKVSVGLVNDIRSEP